jgi:hypothetical protein
MARRREAAHVALTDTQRERLERLWFYSRKKTLLFTSTDSTRH